MSDENGKVHQLNHIGRPYRLPPEAMEELRRDVDDKSSRLTAYTTTQFENKINELARSNNKMSSSSRFSKSTLTRIRKSVGKTETHICS